MDSNLLSSTLASCAHNPSSFRSLPSLLSFSLQTHRTPRYISSVLSEPIGGSLFIYDARRSVGKRTLSGLISVEISVRREHYLSEGCRERGATFTSREFLDTQTHHLLRITDMITS